MEMEAQESVESSTNQAESQYLRLKDCTKIEVPQVEAKLEIQWSLTTLRGVPLAGLGRLERENEERQTSELVWYLVPKCGMEGVKDQDMEVLIYRLEPQDLEDVQKEHSKFRSQVGGIRDYVRPGDQDLKSLEQDGQSKKIRTEYHCNFNYGMLRVIPLMKIGLSSITNMALEGRDKLDL